MEELKYPIGKFKKPEIISSGSLTEWIQVIKEFPSTLKKEVRNLNEAQLDTVYRPDGWTIRQVVHHCADSHMNSFVRFKLALTENKPTIKPYDEDKWATLPDTITTPIQPSLQLLEGLHQRWVILLESLSEKDFKKSFIHPEHGREVLLEHNLALYAWHCKHHLAHITNLKKRKGY